MYAAAVALFAKPGIWNVLPGLTRRSTWTP
jgi:hypothetical protein